MLRLLLFATALPISALAAGDYVVTITGTIQSSAAVPVELYIGPSEGKCVGKADAQTDSKGTFAFTRTVERSWRETFAVFVRTFSLCARDGDHWVELWSLRTGPPPGRIAFDCASTNTKVRPCRVEWDGRVLQSVQPNSRLVSDKFRVALRSIHFAPQPGR